MDEEKVDEEKKREINFYVTLVIIVAVVIGIILIPKMFEKKPEVKTIDDLIKDTIKDGETDTRRIYNGFVFIKEGPIWYSQVKDPEKKTLYKFGTRFNPYQTENVTIEGNIDDSFRTGEVFITFQPNEDQLTYISLAAAELSLNLARAMDINVSAACMEEHPDCTRVISCNNSDRPVIELIRSDEPKLVMEGNCMRIQGKEFELLRIVDRVIFRAYGIMTG